MEGMQLAYYCPKCGYLTRTAPRPGDAAIACSHCRQAIQTPADGYVDGRLARCLVCPSTDLFVRKDFPQRLGVGIVALGIVGSSVAWAYGMIFVTYGILFATALLDVVLYLFVPNALMCYRCGAIYRQAPGLDSHAPFDLETHERYRQQAARLAASRPASAAPRG